MGDAMKKVQAGDALKIPAETFNTFIDAAKDLKDRQQSRRRAHEPRYPNSGVVKVRNESGQDRDRFDVLGLVSPIIDPTANLQAFKNEPALEGLKPQDPGHFGKFAILLEPVKDGEIAHYACVSGVTPARVNVTKQWHDRADVRHDDPTCLQSGEYGSAMILWKQPGTGVKWALVKIGLPYDEAFWARIIAHEKVGPNKWKYSFLEVVHADDDYGYGAWVPKPYGRSGYCYNSVEDPNDGVGVEGNGVDIDALDECCEQWATDCCEGGSSSGNGPGACDCHLLPAGPGAIVRMHGIKQGTGTQPQIEYWFQFENQVDCCPPPSSSYSSSSSGPPPSSSSSGPPSSSSGPSSSGPSSSLGEGPSIDVLVCEPYNQCGHYFVFPQKRIHLPPGSWIEDIEASVIPIFECQSSSGSSSSSSGLPSSSDGSSSSSDGSSSGPSSSGSSSGPPSSSGPSSSSGVSSSSSGPSSSLPSSSGTNPSSSNGQSSSQP